MDVQRRFDEVDIPLDVTWLDIEYADEHRYFDWDEKHFPDPKRMQEAVASKGRKVSLPQCSISPQRSISQDRIHAD